MCLGFDDGETWGRFGLRSGVSRVSDTLRTPGYLNSCDGGQVIICAIAVNGAEV